MSAAAPRLVRVGLVLPEGNPIAECVRRGAEMGAEEARHTAELLGVRFELTAAGMRDATKLAASPETLALIGLPGTGLGEVADQHQVLFLSIGEATETGRYRFHMASSLSRRVDALARWLVQEKGWRRWHFVSSGEHDPAYKLARRALAAHRGEETAADKADLLFVTFGGDRLTRLLETAPRPSRIAGPFAPLRLTGKSGIWPADWHPGLVRFGAEQLNQRFRARFQQPMDGSAWTGWAAVKALAELALRNPDLRRAELPARLEALRFDGHKGSRLSFDPADHHLRQPVHLIGVQEPAGRYVVLAEMELE